MTIDVRDQVLIVVLMYLFVSMITGLLPYGKKRVDDLEQFHSATRGTPDWCLVFCVLSTIYTSSTWTGWVPLTTRIGILGIYTIVYIAFGAILYRILSPEVYKTACASKIYSLGGYLEYKLDSRATNVFVSTVSIVIGAIWVVMELKSLGIIICAAFNFNISFVSAIVVGLLVIVVYIIWGGMESAVWSASLHGFIMLVGGIIISIALVYYRYGSISAFLTIIQKNAYIMEINYDNFNKLGNISQWISNAITSALGMVCLPQLFSRMVVGKSIRTQKIISKWVGISSLWCFSFILIGYIAMIENIQIEDSSNLIFEIMAISNHSWLMYLTYVVMMAAAMGTLDITLFSLSTIIMTTFALKRDKDGTLNYINKRCSYVSISRFVIIILASFCMAIAIVIENNLVDLAIASYQYICIIFPSLCYATFIKNKRQYVPFVALLCGFVLTTIIELTNIDIPMTAGFWGILTNSLILFCTSFFSRKKSSHV